MTYVIRKYLVLLCIAVIVTGTVSLSFSQITPPENYLGFQPGDDFHLATYEQWVGYMELLASETNRLQVFDMGPTSEGRQMKYAAISSEENLAHLDHYKNITRTLSLAQGITDEEATMLAADGKAVVWIDSGIHSTESSPPVQQFQLAYDLVTGSDSETEYVRNNVILLLLIANPDGMTLVADWYEKYLGTEFETSRPPVIYHKYAGHDNNRDAFLANLLETQNMNRLSGTVWFPEIIYAQHERAPFPARIWIPPNPEPVNPNIHPLVTRWKNLIGAAMGQRFDALDMSGVISRISFDLWYPGYLDGPSVEGHNIPTILTETANYGYATPHFYTLNDFPDAYRDLTPGTFYPRPWEGGWWRFKDAVQYNLTASKAVLVVAAKYRYELLYNKYKIAKDVIEKFSSEPPYGWIVSSEQNDPGTVALFLNRLIEFGIEVYTAENSFSQNGISYPKGSYIIPTSQSFGSYVKILFESQEYPDLRKYSHLWQGISRLVEIDGAPLVPYDGVGWTVPVQMGIDAAVMDTPLDVTVSNAAVALLPAGGVSGNGPQYILSSAVNNSFRAVNLILSEGGTVSRASSAFTFHDMEYPGGSFLIESGSLNKSTLQTIASETNITMIGGQPSIQSRQISAKRIGLYKPWTANMDAGWISLIFENYEFPYEFITDAEIRAGNLYERFDVIILPDQRASSIINGNEKGTLPPEYVGGITKAGADNLKSFVVSGGTLVCHKLSSQLPIEEFDLPVTNILQGVSVDSFNCPGSILKMDYSSESSLTFGIPKEGIAFFSQGLAFEIDENSFGANDIDESLSPKVAASYPDGDLLISGWILGEELIQNRAAIVEVPYGDGIIFLLGFSSHNRSQSYATFKLLFNTVYY